MFLPTETSRLQALLPSEVLSSTIIAVPLQLAKKLKFLPNEIVGCSFTSTKRVNTEIFKQSDPGSTLDSLQIFMQHDRHINNLRGICCMYPCADFSEPETKKLKPKTYSKISFSTRDFKTLFLKNRKTGWQKHVYDILCGLICSIYSSFYMNKCFAKYLVSCTIVTPELNDFTPLKKTSFPLAIHKLSSFCCTFSVLFPFSKTLATWYNW